MSSLGVESCSQGIYQMISDLDADGKGQISFEELVELMAPRVSEKGSREHIRRVFNLLDDDKQGYLSIKNLRRIAKELGESVEDCELQEMIERADLDNDSLVSEEEFYNLMTKRMFLA
jgi:Ca2+-binding EF-hand superfamily protein